MSLQWPSLLWLFFLVPVLALLYFLAQRRRRKYAARYASLLVVKDALGKGPGMRRHVPVILFLAGLAIGIFALSRPEATVMLPSNRGTVILALDISGSMRARDIKPSRLEAAKTAARTFIEKQPRRVRVGIVAFAGTAALVQAPTTVRDDLYAAIDRLYPQRATAVGSAILVALNAIFEDAKNAVPESRTNPGPRIPSLSIRRAHLPSRPLTSPLRRELIRSSRIPSPRVPIPLPQSSCSRMGRQTLARIPWMPPTRRQSGACGYSRSASAPRGETSSARRAVPSAWRWTRKR